MPIFKTTTGDFAGVLSPNLASVLLKPDAPAGDPRYVRTWAEVMAAIQSSREPMRVLVDCRTSGPYAIPAGTYPMRGAFLTGIALGNPDANKLTAGPAVQLLELGGIVSGLSLDMSPSGAPAIVLQEYGPALPPVLTLAWGGTIANFGSRALIDGPASPGGPGVVLAFLPGGAFNPASSAPLVALAPNTGLVLSQFGPAENAQNMVSGDASTTVFENGASGPVADLAIGFAGTIIQAPAGCYWSATTAQRNANLPIIGQNKGFSIFDTTLGYPIWWTGTGWVDSTGAPA